MADAIFGKIDPSGKLPVTWPSDAATTGGDFNTGAPSPLGDQPKVFDQLPYTGSGQGSGYNPLYPFAFGLSYTTFKVSGLSATSSVSRARHGDRQVHRVEHRQPGGHRHRAGVRPPAGQRRCSSRTSGSRDSPG